MIAAERQQDFPLDQLVTTATVFLLLYGLIMVGSASTEVSDKLYGEPFHLALKHGFYVVLSLGVGGLALLLPVQFWQRIDWVLLLLSFALLIAVLPCVGRNGSTRLIPGLFYPARLGICEAVFYRLCGRLSGAP
ncbi:MAG: FtsW/RodA/SpoVE family cell cycle protein [Pseudomonadales bacterium]